jgi:hypothetical protein
MSRGPVDRARLENKRSHRVWPLPMAGFYAVLESEGRRMPTSSMVLRPVTPALPLIDMHIALAYKAHSSSELVRLFVDVVREVVAKHNRPRARSA